MTEYRRLAGARRRVIVGACLFGGVALMGALLGPLWWELVPVRAEGTALGDGEVFTGASEDVFAGEGYFVVMTAIAGLVTGYIAYMAQFPLARRQEQDLRMVCLIAGLAGSVAATLLTWRIGTALDAPLHAALAAAEPGETVEIGLRLRATAFLVAWPFVFVLQYALLDLISAIRRDQPGVTEPAPAPVPAPAHAPAADSDSDFGADSGTDAQGGPGPGQVAGTDEETLHGADAGGAADTPRTPARGGPESGPPAHRNYSEGEPGSDER
ncbi:hypothetical protein DFP74_5554 [Nocardiopsis sp. Huas11]|uniref:hypothetical protein n=1 Tax=Nocardiopsis sp. Huas11 TaxID=2183912 RepID=UPI000F151B94|nr:hypothetical protein [Nocardiopsis sp. Huas11]RKS09809.1 hypothetical protein DFP74_5554 [Nocardiopsis sp. Huas11]